MKYASGVIFAHHGFHKHPRPTHNLHLTRDEQHLFEELVATHPTLGPARLTVGVPGLHGPGQAASDISPVLLNKDRVKKELSTLRGSENKDLGSAFREFHTFCEENPDFVTHSEMGKRTVICMQTPLLRQLLVKNSRIEGEPLNGMVSDAAHGFWRERNNLLIVSSAYSLDLRAWVPGQLTYSDGSTEEHYATHFYRLFLSIAEERRSRGQTVTDADLPTVRHTLLSH